MSSSSFSLLRLPTLPLAEILQLTELKEQCKLSFCSKQMYCIVKHFRGKSTVSLKLSDVGADINICLLNEKCPDDEVTFKVKRHYEINRFGWETYKTHGNMSFSKNPDLFISFSEHVVQETITLVEHLCDLFTARVKKVEISNYKIWMLDIVEERQGAFSYDAEIWNIDNRTDEQLRHILLDLNPRSLDIDHKASEQFRIENFHKKYNNLTISAGKWVTIENIYQLDCVELKIHGRYYSNSEVNLYLKHVLRGGAPRLRKFFAEVQNANEDAILDGIQELWTGMELVEGGGNWHVNGTVAREEGLVEVSIMHLFADISLEIKEI